MPQNGSRPVAAKAPGSYDRDAMNRRNPPFLRALLVLLLTVGPLQAQTVFACAMMDAVMHGHCCCDEHSDDETVVETSEAACCERSVEVNPDHQDARHGTPAGKQTDVRADADPPPILLVGVDASESLRTTAHPDPLISSPAGAHSGSDTWLTTQRLRI